MISPGDAFRILAMIAAYDQRTVGETDGLAWHTALNLADPPINFDDAMTAVATWHAENTEGRIRPAHVIQGAQLVARRRAGAERAARLADMRALPAAPEQELTPERREQMLAAIPPGVPNILRRREWVRWERERSRGDEGPNRLFTGFPPPAGHPVPGDDDEAVAS